MMFFDKFESARSAQGTSNAFTSFAALLIVSGLTSCSPGGEKPTVAPDPNKPIQIGWMTSGATSGQIMQTLNHTNITDLYAVPAVVRGYVSGKDVNEAALHGEVDCVNDDLVPTLSLLAASSDWVVVGRLADSPLSVVARTGSHVESIRDLKGKTIAVSFGSASHPYVLDLLAKNDLQLGEGKEKVKLVDLKISEQAPAMQKGSIDAVGSLEPETAIMLSKNLGKVINSEHHTGAITVRKSIADNDPKRIINLLKAYIQANHYVAGHSQQTDLWYLAGAQIEPKVLPFVSVIEPNTKAVKTSDVHIEMKAEDLALAQSLADTMLKAKLIPTAVEFNSRTNPSFLQKAISELNVDGYKTKEIREVGEHR